MSKRLVQFRKWKNGIIWMLLLSFMVSMFPAAVTAAAVDEGAAVFAAGNRTYVIKPDGTLWAKGAGPHGNGTNVSSKTFVQVLSSAGPIVSVDGNPQHLLALGEDGRVWAWGNNQQGQLGNGEFAGNNVPVQNPVRVDFGDPSVRIKAVKTGQNYSLALSEDGRVWEWGVSPTASGTAHRKSRPALVVDPASGEPLAGIHAIEANGTSAFAITDHGDVWAWGNNTSHFKLGLPESRYYTPTKLDLRQVESIAAGPYHTIALTTDGRVWGWGYSQNGQLGENVPVNERRAVPTLLPGLEQVQSIAAGGSVTFALKSDGTLWALGSRYRLGLGEQQEDSAVPLQVGGDAGHGIRTISIRQDHALALRNDGTILGWGSNHFTHKQIIDTPDTVTSVIYTPVVIPFDNLSAGIRPQYAELAPMRGSHTASADADVKVRFDKNIQAGGGMSGISISDDQGHSVGGLAPSVTGSELSIAHNAFEPETTYTVTVPANAIIDTNGNGNRPIRWSFTTLPDEGPPPPGVQESRPTAGATNIWPNAAIWVQYDRQVQAGPAIGDVTIVSESNVAADRVHAVLEDNKLTVLHGPLAENTVYTVTIPAGAVTDTLLGTNNEAQVWSFTTGTAESPSGSGAILAAGHNFTFVSEPDGKLWGWGQNTESAYLGSGNKLEQLTPTLVRGLAESAAIAPGSNFTAAIREDGTVWTWGAGAQGQLGHGTTDNRLAPTQVDGLSNVVSIASGTNHVAAVRSDGTVWTWGAGAQGQLGHGATENLAVPTQVEGLANIVAVAAGDTHTLALKADGTVWAWGAGTQGQLGHGQRVNSSEPVQVEGVTHIVALAAGSAHSYAVRQDGKVWAWGSNSHGQLGLGKLQAVNSAVPVPVPGLEDVRIVASAQNTGFALTGEGSVWSWGSNGSGLLGTSSEEQDRHTPALVLDEVEQIASKQTHAVVLKNDGTIWAWGNNGTANNGYVTIEPDAGHPVRAPVQTLFGRLNAEHAPAVELAVPDRGDIEVALDAPLVLTFNKDVSLASGRNLNEITVSQRFGAAIAKQAALEGRTITLQPDAPLAIRQVYQVDVPEGLLVDGSGNASKRLTYSFTTIQGDTEAPVPVVRRPAAGEEHVLVTASIEVQFDEPVFPHTALSNIAVADAQGNQVGVTALTSGNRLAIGHDPLAHSTSYTVTVPANAVRDGLGNGNAAFSWTFVTAGEAGDEVEVHFIDVGQGDGIYIKLPGNIDVVIDSGHYQRPSTVVNYLASQGVDDIEYLIATHPDADHIGGMVNILNRFVVDNIIDNGDTSTTQTYRNYETARNNEIASGANYIRVRDQSELRTFVLTDNAVLRLLSPIRSTGDLNNRSIVALLSVGEIDVLLTGDAESTAENAMLAAAASGGYSLQSEVLKVGHHGSSSSSSAAFLQAVDPISAIISVGSNSYGHPTQAVLDRLNAVGAEVYRTDRDSVNGAIVMVTDGASYKINDEWIIGGDPGEPQPSNRPAADKLELTRAEDGKARLVGTAGAVQSGATIAIYADSGKLEKLAETTADHAGAFEVVFDLASTAERVYVAATEAGKTESGATAVSVETGIEARAAVSLELPGVAQVRPGEPFKVNVRLNDYANLYGAQVGLSYDPAKLTIVDADPEREGLQIGIGNVYGERSYVEVLNHVSAEEGKVAFASMLLEAAEGVHGDSAILAELTFSALPGEGGETEIGFAAGDVKLAAPPAGEPASWRINPDIGEPMVVSVQAGEPEPGETTMFLEADRTTAAPGETVTVSVMLDDYDDLYGTQLQVRYDSSLLRLVDQDNEAAGVQLRPGGIFAGNRLEQLLNEADEVSGTAVYAGVLAGEPEGVSGTEPVSIVDLVFEPIGTAGDASVELVAEKVKLAGYPRGGSAHVPIEFLVGSEEVTIRVDGEIPADTEAPTWPKDSRLEAVDRTTSSISLKWTEAEDNAGVAGYTVYNGDDEVTTVTATTYTVTGLSSGTAYTFTVRAFDASGNQSEALTLETSTLSSQGGGWTGPSIPREPAFQDVASGLMVNASSIRKSTVSDAGKQATLLTLDKSIWEEAFAQLETKPANRQALVISAEEGDSLVHLQIPVSELLEGLKKAPDTYVVLEVGSASYELPLALLDYEEAARATGIAVDGLTLTLVIEVVREEDRQLIERQLAASGASLVSDAVQFRLFIEGNGTRVEISDFEGTRVKRTLTVSDDLNPNASTGVRIEDDGQISFVPSVFRVEDGVRKAVLMSDSNSIYAVIEHRKTFADIQNHWAKSDIELMASKLVVSGKSDTIFDPQASITRAEFAALLVRALGLKAQDGTMPFSDVAAGAWYAAEVRTAAQHGLINGFEDDTFRPEGLINREQMAVMIARAMTVAGVPDSQAGGSEFARFADSGDVSPWAQNELSKAVRSGIIQGITADSFAPKEQANRAQAVVMLKRLLQHAGFIN